MLNHHFSLRTQPEAHPYTDASMSSRLFFAARSQPTEVMPKRLSDHSMAQSALVLGMCSTSNIMCRVRLAGLAKTIAPRTLIVVHTAGLGSYRTHSAPAHSIRSSLAMAQSPCCLIVVVWMASSIHRCGTDGNHAR